MATGNVLHQSIKTALSRGWLDSREEDGGQQDEETGWANGFNSTELPRSNSSKIRRSCIDRLSLRTSPDAIFATLSSQLLLKHNQQARLQGTPAQFGDQPIIKNTEPE